MYPHENCPDGLSFSVWISFPKRNIVFWEAGTVQVVLMLEGGFYFYIRDTRFIIEVFNQTAIDFPNPFPFAPRNLDGIFVQVFEDWIWKNIGVSWNRRANQLDVHVNGKPIKSRVLPRENWLFTNAEDPFQALGTLVFGYERGRFTPGLTIQALHLMHLAIWRRYLFPFEAHRFFGISGINCKCSKILVLELKIQI